MSQTFSRRRFLTGTALGSAGAAAALVAGSAGARALTIEPASAHAHALYANRCGGAGTSAYHHQLVADMTAKLAGTMSEAQIETVLAGLTCPICGCPLAGLL